MEPMRAFLAEALDALAVDYADVRIEDAERTGIVYRGPVLDTIGRSFERGGCIRVFHRGNWGVATFNSVDDSLKTLAREVATQVETLPPREVTLAPLGPHEETIRLKPGQDVREVALTEKHDLIRHYNEIVLAAKGIETSVAAYRDLHRYVVFYSSDDRYIDQELVDCGFVCQAVARDGTNIQTYGDAFGKPQGFAALRSREPLVERIPKIALELLKAEPVTAGKYTVIIDPLLAGVFVHEAFGHLSESDHIAENERLQELMRVGTRFGVDGLTIVDDATMPGERGSYQYDDEGASAERTELVRHGILVDHLHNRETAGRMNEPPTGNGRAISYRYPPLVRMSNTYIEPRDVEIDDMFEGLEQGLYVVGSRGGMTELESFTFSSQYGYKIEHGRKTGMVRDITLSGNVFETMKNIEAIGDDLVMFGGTGGCGKHGQGPLPVGLGAPHLKIRNVVIGGR